MVGSDVFPTKIVPFEGRTVSFGECKTQRLGVGERCIYIDRDV